MENLLKRNVQKESGYNKGALVGQIIGLTIAIIVIVAVSIPVVNQVVDDANLTGTTATVVGLIPMFLGLAALVITTAILAG
jgi:protein-S-isoprenylcysteine O-methyltransferase Ste14